MSGVHRERRHLRPGRHRRHEPAAETLWATPDADGVIPRGTTCRRPDLGEGLEGAVGVRRRAPTPSSSAGRPPSGLTAGVARTNLAPQEPFFQLGLLGATVPALKLDGEIGQQIGYLNAATVGAVNFILLILVGWGFNHKEKVRALVATAGGAAGAEPGRVPAAHRPPAAGGRQSGGRPVSRGAGPRRARPGRA